MQDDCNNEESKEQVTKESDENILEDISNMLKSEVRDELDIEQDAEEESPIVPVQRRSKKKKILTIAGIIMGVFVIVILFLAATKPGHTIVTKIVAWYISMRIKEQPVDNPDTLVVIPSNDPNMAVENNEYEITPKVTPALLKAPRSEEHVMNCLLIGIEEIYGARNTDTMMLASINTETNVITLVSFLRDTYVDIDGYRSNKLNSVYVHGTDNAEGANLLLRTLENTYNIKIDAYASVNFEAFEDIINMLGGVTIELGEKEAAYLRKENYISNPSNRNVYAGVQILNGNQALGYCRVRKVETLGGAVDDYGRTLRQRRVMKAIYEKCKSKSILDLGFFGNKCLSYVKSNLNYTQIETLLNFVRTNGIPELESTRLPANGMYYDSGSEGYDGIKYTLVIDKEANTKYLYQLLYGDSEEEAEENYKKYVGEVEIPEEPVVVIPEFLWD